MHAAHLALVLAVVVDKFEEICVFLASIEVKAITTVLNLDMCDLVSTPAESMTLTDATKVE